MFKRYSKEDLFLLSMVLTLLFVICVDYAPARAANTCLPGTVCTFRTPNDASARYNMFHLLQSKGDTWTVKANSRDSFNSRFGDFDAATGYVNAYGVPAGALCDMASIFNHFWIVNFGNITKSSPHVINGVYYPVLDVPTKDRTVVIWDVTGPVKWGDKGMPTSSTQDLVIINDTDQDMTIKWAIEGTEIKMWVDGNSTYSPPPAVVENTIAAAAKNPATEFVVEGGIAFEKNVQLPILDLSFFYDHRTFSMILVFFVSLLLVFFIGNLVYSGDFRRLVLVLLFVGIVVTVAFVGVSQVSAETTVISASRSTEFVVETTSSEWVVETDTTKQEIAPAPVMPPSQAGCSLPTSYPDKILRWCSYIEKWAAERKMDPRMIAAVMLQESGGNPEILSKSGATGLLQVMPRDGIAATFHNSAGVPYFSNRPSIEQLKNPEFNIQYGSGMLERLGINTNAREALLHYGPDPKDLLRVYGSRYYYADIVLSIYNSHK